MINPITTDAQPTALRPAANANAASFSPLLFKLLFTLFFTLFLSGCVTSTSYKWGNYEQNIFDYYHEPGRKDKVIESHIAMVSGDSTQLLAPGMYAEAGTFYLERGDTQNAIFFYTKEKEAWPESAKLMNALIKNLRGDSTEGESTEGASPTP